jgi:hypothetical protein
MSHFAKVKFSGELRLIQQVLERMGLEYTLYPDGKALRCNPSWQKNNKEQVAHLIVSPRSLERRSGVNREISMDFGFQRQEDGRYSPILDEYVMRGNNEFMAQQFTQEYSIAALEERGFQVVRDEAGNPIIDRDKVTGLSKLQFTQPAKVVVRR